MSSPASVPEYCTALGRSRLLSGERVAMLHNVWLARAAGSDADTDGFRRYLVAGRHLTEYQSECILRGETDGFLLAGYVILDRFARFPGSFKAVHPSSGQVVALRKLSPGSDPKNIARFQRDGRILVQLDHANVHRAYHLGNADGTQFLATDTFDGETLEEMIARRKAIPADEAVRLVHQALQALQYLHEKRLRHGEIHPGSLLIGAASANTLNATVRMLDLAFRRDFFAEEPMANPAIAEYMSPEMARDPRSTDIRADIYSLGCVLYALLAGHPPFVETDQTALIVRHATEPPPSILSLQPETPPGLAAVLKVMLAKQPEDRFGIPQEAAEALEPFLPLECPVAMKPRIIPAYQQWLSTQVREPLATIGGPATGPRLSGPVSSSRIRTPMSGPVSGTRLGTGLAAAIGSGGIANPPRTAPTLKPPTAPPRPAPNLVDPNAAKPMTDTDVELMPLNELQARIVHSPLARPLWVLDRRDMIMLAIGAGAVAVAVAAGMFVAKFNSDKIRRPPDEP